MDVCIMHFSGGDTTIESLGAPLNTPGWDGDFYVSPDGRYLFYSRGTSPADCHIYWVRFDRLLAQMRASAR